MQYKSSYVVFFNTIFINLLFQIDSDTYFHPLSEITCTSTQCGDKPDVYRLSMSPPVLHKGCVYVAGDDVSSTEGQIFEYNIAEKTWNPIPIPCYGSDSYALTLYHGKLLLVGGRIVEEHVSNNSWTSCLSDKIFEYDEESCTFIESSIIPPVPDVRNCRSVSVTSEGDHLVVVHRKLDQNERIVVKIFDGTTHKWSEQVADSKRNDSSDSVRIIIHKESLYVVYYNTQGIQNVLYTSLQTLKEETTASPSTWHELTNPLPKHNHSNVIFIDDYMLVVAASNSNCQLLFAYSFKCERWTEIGAFDITLAAENSYTNSIVGLPDHSVLLMGWVRDRDDILHLNKPSFDVMLLQPHSKFISDNVSFIRIVEHVCVFSVRFLSIALFLNSLAAILSFVDTHI